MTGCDAFRRLISAYLDGELVGEDRGAFEAHVAGCSSCRASLAEERNVVELLRDAEPLYEAPAPLRRRVIDILAAAQRRRIPWTALAAALALVVAGVFWLSRKHTSPSEPVAAELQIPSDLASFAARTHLHYTRGELPLDVTSDRADDVSDWFASRVPFHLKLPDYPVGPGERKQYRLTGGRLVSYKNDSAAFVAYRMGTRPISLFVTSASLVRPAGGDVVTSGSLRFHIEPVEGLKVITWTDKGLTYALASDLDVEGSHSCLVCHGAPEERGKVEPLSRAPVTD